MPCSGCRTKIGRGWTGPNIRRRKGRGTRGERGASADCGAISLAARARSRARALQNLLSAGDLLEIGHSMPLQATVLGAASPGSPWPALLASSHPWCGYTGAAKGCAVSPTKLEIEAPLQNRRDGLAVLQRRLVLGQLDGADRGLVEHAARR